MMYLEMFTLIRAMPLKASRDDFARAIVDDNILEKPTLGSRKSSLHHLVELYGMDSSKALFRVLWNLGHGDLDSLPQLYVSYLQRYARDLQLRHKLRTCPIAAPWRDT